jgi:hypothetical protein
VNYTVVIQLSLAELRFWSCKMTHVYGITTYFSVFLLLHNVSLSCMIVSDGKRKILNFSFEVATSTPPLTHSL